MAWAENRALVGRTRRGARRRGRGPQGRRHRPAVRPGARQPPRPLRSRRARTARPPRPGDVVEVEITYAAPHHLVADGRRSRCAAPVPATPGPPAPAAHARHAAVPGVLARPRPVWPPMPTHGAAAPHAGYGRAVPVLAAAFCPHPPLLAPALAGGAARRARRAARRVRRGGPRDRGVRRPGPRRSGPRRRRRTYGSEAAGTLAPWGVDVRAGGGDAPTLPLSLTLGAWLLDRAQVDLDCAPATPRWPTTGATA